MNGDLRRTSRRNGQGIEPRLNAGDVVLFSGNGRIHSRFQALMRSRWGQVGIVVYPPHILEPCLLMATSIPSWPSIETSSPETGVWTTPLSPAIAAFDGRVAARRLSPCLDSDSCEKLSDFRRMVVERPFDFNLLSSRRSLRRTHTVWRPSCFMCASLVAFAYQSIGVMSPPPEGRLPNNTLPSDFSIVDSFPMLNGYSLDADMLFLK
jgi:hypothetical protein